MATVPLALYRNRYVRLLSRAWKLRPLDVWLLVQMSALLGQILFLQRRLPLDDLVRRFDTAPADRVRPAVSLRRLNVLVTGLLSLIYGSDFCMKRSLILFHYMRKWGYPVHIHFGVAKENGALKGHAWVDLAGHPFAEEADPRQAYRVTYTYPAA
ncbi:MAG: lasso peptide biosynthesis B2 protein [Bacteroidetes bacterium]|nr:hypothetical protein AWN76_002360 [Rhodothermaceae bacterium RA]RMH49156.1 MAG: lasso peptide biosynthesis B2 protein [Bacteroidota bacterium]